MNFISTLDSTGLDNRCIHCGEKAKYRVMFLWQRLDIEYRLTIEPFCEKCYKERWMYPPNEWNIVTELFITNFRKKLAKSVNVEFLDYTNYVR